MMAALHFRLIFLNLQIVKKKGTKTAFLLRTCTSDDRTGSLVP